MPLVTLPNGQTINMPERLDAQQLGEFRSWVEGMKAAVTNRQPEAAAAPTGAEPSRFTTSMHRFEREALPAVVGGLGGLATQMAIPIPGSGIVGGMGLAYGTQAAEEAFLRAHPDFAKSIGQDPETRAAEETAHPIVAKVSEALPYLAGARPNFGIFKSLPADIKALARAGAEKEVSGIARSAEEETAMKQVSAASQARMLGLGRMAMGAGIMGGINLGQQTFSDQPFDTRDLMITSALGMLGTEESGFGRRQRALVENIANRFKPKTEPTAGAESATTPTTPVSATGESATAPAVPPAVTPTPAADARPVTPAASILGESPPPAVAAEKSPAATPVMAEAPAAQPTDVNNHAPLKQYLADMASQSKTPNFIKLKQLARQANIPTPNGLKVPELIAHLNKAMAPEEVANVGTQPTEPTEVQPGPVGAGIAGDNTNIGATAAGVQPPVPQDGTAGPEAQVADVQRVDVANQRPVGPDVGASAQPTPLEAALRANPYQTQLKLQAAKAMIPKEPTPEAPAKIRAALDPEKKALVDRMVDGFSRGHINTDDVSTIREQLRSGEPDYDGINAFLDKRGVPKQYTEEDVETQRTADDLLKTMNRGARAQKPKTPQEIKEQEEINAFVQRRNAEENAANKLKPRRSHNPGLRFYGADEPLSTPDGMSQEQAQSVKDKLMGGWKNAPDVVFHNSTETAPEPVPSDTRGYYDPQTQNIHAFLNNITSPAQLRRILNHESLGHYGLRQKFGDNFIDVLKDIYRTNPAMQKAADNWIEAQNSDFYRDIHPEDMKHIATDEVLAKASEAGPNIPTGIKAALNTMVARVRNWLRQNFPSMVKTYSDNDIKHLLSEMHQSVMGERVRSYMGMPSDMGMLAGPAPTTAKAPPAPTRTLDEMRAEGRARFDKKVPETGIRPTVGGWWNKIVNTDYNKLVTALEDHQRPLKLSDQWLWNAKQLISGGKGGRKDFNDVGRASAAATALGKNIMINDAIPLINKHNQTIYDYAQGAKLSTKDALNDLHHLELAKNEAERRHDVAVQHKPLSTVMKYTLPDGTQTVAADLRKDIMGHLESGVPWTQAQLDKFHGILDHLTDPKNGFVDPTGYSPSGSKGINDSDSDYQVAGTFKPEEIKKWTDEYDRQMKDPTMGPLLKAHRGALDAIQEKRIELDRNSNYWSQAADNIKRFYNWSNYIPLKGGTNLADKIDFGNKNLSGAFSEWERAMHGRVTDSDNGVVQSQVDLARSAARAGNLEPATAFKNLIDQGYIKVKGKPIEVSFADRHNNNVDVKALKKRNAFFFYHPDGSMTVYKIAKDSMPMLEGLKGTIENNQNLIVRAGNFIRPATSMMGRMHTMLNVAFPPFNMARHLITNSLNLSAGEYGLGVTPKILTNALINTTSGEFLTSMKMYNSYMMKGDVAGFTKMALASPPGSVARNLYEIITEAGDTAMPDALNHKNTVDQMLEGSKRVGGNIVLKSADKIGDALNVWSHGFELMNRATCYGVIKPIIREKLYAQGLRGNDLDIQTRTRAAAETKNLLNFQNVGTYGRDLSSYFMFWRASATGAVRALDALRPAFISTKTYLEGVPEAYKNTPDKVANLTASYEKLRKNARMTAMLTTAAGYGLYQIARSMASNDSQGRNIVATDNMDQWQRTMRFPAAFFGDKNNNAFVQYPWGYGLGALASAGAQMAGYLEGHTSTKDMIWNIINPIRESFAPVPTPSFNPMKDSKTALNFVIDTATPSAFRPFVEAAMNMDTFGREVTPTIQSKYGDIYAAGENVPAIYKEFSQALLENTGVVMHPQTVQFILNNYFDGATRVAQNITSDAQTMVGSRDWDPKQSMITMPFADFIGKTTSVDAKEFASVEQDIKNMRTMVDMYQSTGHADQLNKYYENHPNAQLLIELYNKSVNSEQGIKGMREDIKKIEASDMNDRDKHYVLKDLRAGRDMAMRGFVDAYKQLSN